ncbi:MAG TPA: L-threonylcarbamoyladenylate synthase [Patescibacteria group bacterium]
MNEHIEKAVEIINNGGIVIFPTDTAFGIGCRVDNEAAIQKLFKLRKRPEQQATPVLVSSLDMAKAYWIEVPEEVVKKLIKPYWPGALTIVLPCKISKVPVLVRGGGTTLGLRMPNHETTLNIIKGVGVPIIGTSANFSGEQTPYTVEDLNPELKKLVDYVVPGKCPGQQASTVIDCSVEPWKILREGAVKLNF